MQYLTFIKRLINNNKCYPRLQFSILQDEHFCSVFLTLDGRGQQLPGVFRGYPLISPKTGTQKSEHEINDKCQGKHPQK